MSTKQLTSQDTLVVMNVDLIHKLGRDNVVPHALTLQEKQHSMTTFMTTFSVI
jgi:hypothetical protein